MVLLGGCVSTPSVEGVAGTSPAPSAEWKPPHAQTRAPVPTPTTTTAAIPPDLAQRLQQLTLADIVDLGLRNNPATQESWRSARAAAAAFGSQQGAYYPTIDADLGGTRQKTVGRFAVQQTTYGPSATLSWLLLDYGGRAGAIDVARQGLIAADWTHNATIQNVVLQVESAYFNYVATRALLQAQDATLNDARANLAAAEERHRVGVATIADVLQARTAVAQAQLDLETTGATLHTTRGALALSIGIPANVPYDIEQPTLPVPIAKLADSVDVLIDQAIRARPDLWAAQAQFEQAQANVRQTRAQRYPALSVTGSAGQTYIASSSFPAVGGSNYTIGIGLRVPLFAGFSRAYNEMQAEAQAAAAAARLDALKQQVVYQVFSSYYTLQTATQRVRTADELLASAQQAEEVALGQYKAGVGTVLNLLAAQSALATARAQQVQARWIWETALAQLAHDTGVLGTHGGSPLRLVPDSTNKGPPR